jgi:hypothetical protein
MVASLASTPLSVTGVTVNGAGMWYSMTGPVGLFPGSFTLLGGSNGAAQNILASKNFQVVATPEPSTFLLIGTGLSSLAAVVRRRRSLSIN